MATAVPEAASVTKRQYNQLYSEWTEQDECVCWHCTYTLDGELYYLEIAGDTPRPINLELSEGSLVPKSKLYTPWLLEYTRVGQVEADAQDYYIKRVPVHRYYPPTNKDYPGYFRSEIAIHEMLAKHPHPNVLRYHGVLADEASEYVVGICLDRQGVDLKKAIKDETFDDSKLDKEQIMEDIKQALQHLHSLGYIHNDVNPNNILLPLDGTGPAVLADFDSCVPVSTRAAGQMKRGTPGYWENTEHATEENDWYGWSKTGEFLGLSMPGAVEAGTESVVETTSIPIG